MKLQQFDILFSSMNCITKIHKMKEEEEVGMSQLTVFVCVCSFMEVWRFFVEHFVRLN